MRERKSAKSYEQEAIDSMKKCLEDNAHVLERYASDESDGKLLQRYLRSNPSPEKEALKKALAGGAPIRGENGIRKQLAAIDLEYFGRAYLPHYFSRPSPKFHEELNKIWRDGVLKGRNPATSAKEISRLNGCRRAIAAPRGHAKSTNLTFKDALHAILYEYKHYILILSDSSEQAEGFLEDIATELEDNSEIIEDFGALKDFPWNSGTLRTSADVKVEAIGSGKKIRGRRHRNYRPDLIILDDVENDENVRTPEQRNKLDSWFKKAVSQAGDTYTDIVYIGTMLHYDSLLAKVMKNPSYQSVLYKGIIRFSDNEALWQEYRRWRGRLVQRQRQYFKKQNGSSGARHV